MTTLDDGLGQEQVLDHAPYLNSLSKLETTEALPRVLGLPLHWVLARARTKKAFEPEWSEKPASPQALRKHLDPGLNGSMAELGIATGERSGWLVRLDFDQPETWVAAQMLLPRTGLVSGRDGALARAPWYHITGHYEAVGSKIQLDYKGLPALTLPNGERRRTKVGELLTTKQQSLIPPSRHPEDPGGYRWYEATRACDLDGLVMVHGFTSACVAGLLAIFAPGEGARHDFDEALQGFFATYSDWSPDWIGAVIRATARASGRDEDWQARGKLSEVERTIALIESPDPHARWTGKPTLETLLGEEGERLTRAIRTFMGWTRAHRGSATSNTRLLGPDGLPLAADGDGLRFLALHQDTVRYVAQQNAYYLDAGTHWALDLTEAIRGRTRAVADSFRATVADALASRQSPFNANGVAPERECLDHALALGNSARQDDMLKQARSMPPIATRLDQLDADPLLLNTPTGVLRLDITTGQVEVLRHDPSDLLTMITHVGYRPGARSALLDEYLDLFFPLEEDPALKLERGARRGLLRLVAGYTLTGLPKRYALHLLGLTNSGKSMTLRLHANTLGSYALALDATSLMVNQFHGGDVPRPDLLRLRNKRLAVVYEVPENARFDVKLFKSMLGGDAQPLRDLYQGSVSIEHLEWTTCLWLAGNKPYGPPPGEEAAFERLLTLRCDHQVPLAQRDHNRQLEILNSREVQEAWLAFAVEGFQELYGPLHGHLVAPDFVQRERERVRDELDPWAVIAKDLFDFTGDPNHGVLKSEAWEAARLHRMEQLGGGRLGNATKERTKFEEMLERHCGPVWHTDGRFGNRWHWRGLRWQDGEQRPHGVTLPDW